MINIDNIIQDVSLFIINNDTSFHIGYGIDNNYARCVGTSIASICLNNPNEKFSFHIVTNYLSHNNINKFKDLSNKYKINIYIYTINEQLFLSLPVSNYFPISIYFRLILPLIVKNTNIIKYLDADIICLNRIDIEFITKNIQTKTILAVPDVSYMQKNRCKALNLNNHIYFNSGFLVINKKRWEEQSVFHQVLQILNEKHHQFTHPDQDALNIVCKNNTGYLDKTYNCIDLSNIILNNIIFLHFAANPKPWSIAWKFSKNNNTFNRELYTKYENNTPWKGSPLSPPRNYKEMEFYAKGLRKHFQLKRGLYWYCKYIFSKIKKRLNP